MTHSFSFKYPSDPTLEISAEPVEPASEKGLAFQVRVNGCFVGYIIKKRDHTYSKLGYVKLTEEHIKTIGDKIESSVR